VQKVTAEEVDERIAPERSGGNREDFWGIGSGQAADRGRSLDDRPSRALTPQQ
jgi:hypothetical protein